MLTIAAAVALALFASIAISISFSFIIPIAVAVAIWFLIKKLLDNVMDTSWMTSGVGIAVFVLLLWVII